LVEKYVERMQRNILQKLIFWFYKIWLPSERLEVQKREKLIGTRDYQENWSRGFGNMWKEYREIY
jgi:hypothetical protein